MRARTLTAHLAIMYMAGDIDYLELGDYLVHHFGTGELSMAATEHVFRCTSILAR